MHWAMNYIGKRWEKGATGPETFDCRGMTYDVQLRVYGRVVPSFDIPVTDTPEFRRALNELCRRSNWHRQPDGCQEADGDIVVIGTPDGPHVGVAVEADGDVGLLHCVGTVEDPEDVRFTPMDDIRFMYGPYEVWRHVESVA